MPPPVPVWDRPVRLLHALLALGVTASWVTGWWVTDLHEGPGWVVAAAVLARGVWGVIGSPNARFRQFVRSPAATRAYALQVWRRSEPRYLGHNPLGGWMVVLLLAFAGATSLTGLLYTTDWLWGYGWLAALHGALAWALAAAVALHLGGVAFTARRHRDPLVAAMLHGRKPAPGPNDLRR